MTTSTESSVELAINTIRTLSMDAVQKANSGHPGTPMALAPTGLHALHAGDEAQPGQPGLVRPRPLRPVRGARLDAAVLDALPGRVRADARGPQELPPARQPDRRPSRVRARRPRESRRPPGRWARGSRCRSGMALAERMLAARFNAGDRDLVDHHTYVIASDGDIKEGIGSEACSLAGHLGLGKLIVFYDNNHIQLEGATDDGLHRGRRQALRGLRLARPGRRRGPRRWRRSSARSRRRRAWRTSPR